MYTDGTGQFPILISLAIIFGIGALSGVAGMFIGDAVNAAMTGQWQWSSWETYVGAAVGYGVGAILTAAGMPTLGLAVGGWLSTFTGMPLEKATGTNDRSWLQIGLASAGSFAVGAVMGHMTKGLRIPGLTSGRGSFQHVMKTQFTNMLRHGYNISVKTAAKSFVALTVSRQVIGNVGKGLFRAGQQWWEYIMYGDTYGLGWV